MKQFSTLAALAGAGAAAVRAFPQLKRQPMNTSSAIDTSSAPPDLTTLGNASLYDLWRPIAHVLPVYGNIGDPCMHYVDPSTGSFHVGYLHEGASGATTDDLVTYTDLNPDSAPFIRAGGINDPVAVFDGSVIPAGVNNTPTLLYTSVSFLPIQWTIPYTLGSETQSLAVATDGGRNFTKEAFGPVIAGPPFGVNVTGFRDPFVFQSTQFDRDTSSANGTWYSIISGGVHDVGPKIFLYRQYNLDPTFQTWEFIGEWFNEAANSTWTEAGWAGRWGYNFEVGNVLAFDDQGYNADGEIYVTHGAEWSYDPIVPQVSDNREMLWSAGTQAKDDTGVLRFNVTMAGKLDWGRSAYAAAGKLVPASAKASQASGVSVDRFISYIWLTGDFYGTLPFPAVQQNWTGSLLLPRELRVGFIENVTDGELAREKASWRVESESNSTGTVTLRTLHQEIVPEAVAAFKSNATNAIMQPGSTVSNTTAFAQSPNSTHYLMTSNITFPAGSRNNSELKAGFRILSGPNEYTTIYYQFSNESLIVDRSQSSAARNTTGIGINTDAEVGKFRLFDVQDSSSSGSTIEQLDLTIVVDGGVVEVHANNRFAIGTWVYSWYADSRNIEFFVEGGEVDFADSYVWEGLVDAWPSRSQRAA